MQFHREGGNTILIALMIFFAVLFLAVHFVPQNLSWINLSIIIIACVLLFLVFYFFRKPKRKYILQDSKVLSPCDGKVVAIEEVDADEYFKDKRLQVSIFMSPLNVHINFNPVSGKVMYSQYHKGKYLVAWHPKSSTENERHSVVYQSNGKEILAKQIAGAVARRIVNYLKVGDEVQQCGEMGFIKFGSRVDLLLPIGTKILCKIDDKTKGGVTEIAEW